MLLYDEFYTLSFSCRKSPPFENGGAGGDLKAGKPNPPKSPFAKGGLKSKAKVELHFRGQTKATFSGRGCLSPNTGVESQLFIFLIITSSTLHKNTK
jgi:hypothetical protein